jgi:hypothetical protein
VSPNSSRSVDTERPARAHLLPSFASPLLRVSGTFVKKKAALTLLRLYRKHPEVIPSGDWAERIVSIMDDEDLVSFSSFCCHVHRD